MQSIEFYKQKLSNAPDGFGVTEVKKWLNDINVIQNFSTIEPLFLSNDFNAREWFALIVILRQKYINVMSAKRVTFKNGYENEPLFNRLCHELYLEEDPSLKIDLSNLLSLQKLHLHSLRRCNEIIFHPDSTLEMVELFNMPQLTTVKGLERLTGLKYLSITKCNKLTDFSFIEKLPQLLIINLSANKQLPGVVFSETSLMTVLQLIESNAIKQPNLTRQLVKPKNLRYLSIKANRKETELLRAALPNCIVNGEPALNKL